MQDFSQLHRKCLSDMPMLLDIMATTVEQLKDSFSPIYDEFKSFLEENLPPKFQMSGYWERGTIHLFNSEYKRKYLESLIPYADITYKLGIEQTLKRSPLKLTMQFGYVCDEGHVNDRNQNVIYFQLDDMSEKQFLDGEFLDKLKKNIPTEWRVGSEDNSSIWIEFDMDETLSMEKIKTCADDFKKYILQPIINNLKK